MSSSSADVLVCLVTFPNEEVAAKIGRALVAERLVACINLVPAVRSIYAWNGSISDDAEVLGICKTTSARFADLCARVAALHPYDVPEVLAISPVAGHEPYLKWLRGAVDRG